MHSEDLCQVVQWNLVLDEVDVLLASTIAWDVVLSTLTEFVVLLIDHLWIVVVPQDDINRDSVVEICNSSSVVRFCNHVDESFEWHLIVEVQELDQLQGRDSEVRGGERVWNVPAEWSELSSFEDDGVEEAESPEQPSERDWLGARLEFAICD